MEVEKTVCFWQMSPRKSLEEMDHRLHQYLKIEELSQTPWIKILQYITKYYNICNIYYKYFFSALEIFLLLLLS